MKAGEPYLNDELENKDIVKVKLPDSEESLEEVSYLDEVHFPYLVSDDVSFFAEAKDEVGVCIINVDIIVNFLGNDDARENSPLPRIVFVAEVLGVVVGREAELEPSETRLVSNFIDVRWSRMD